VVILPIFQKITDRKFPCKGEQGQLLCFKPLEEDYKFFQSLVQNKQGHVTVIRAKTGNEYYKNEKKISIQKSYMPNLTPNHGMRSRKMFKR
jgi:hypothetical protein